MTKTTLAGAAPSIRDAPSRDAPARDAPARDAPSSARPAANEDGPDEPPAYELIELFFFAYRDFVADPDRILAEYGFGRAHHRVLHFVDRHPGLTIAELLDILRITKQSLNRVLKELIESGCIEQRAGESDRRQRRLFCAERGRRLARRLALVQTRRVRRALAGEGADGAAGGTPGLEAAARRFLLGVIDPAEREAAARLAAGGAASGTIPSTIPGAATGASPVRA